jgi:MSHA biogenesis protein MshN
MSLINKMLRDLDARGGDGARGEASSLVRPVGRGSRSPLSPLVIGAGLAVFVVLGASGFVAWKYLRGQHAASTPAVAVVRAPAAALTQPVVQANGPVAVVAGDEGPAVVPGNIPPEEHRVAGERMAREMEERNAAARRVAAGVNTAAVGRVDARSPQSDEARANDVKPSGNTNRVATRRAAPGNATVERGATARAATGQAAADGPRVGVAEAGLSPQQKAENEYRRALVKLQDARVSEALAGLERALELYPRHEAARQTLVSLLIESGRNAEAIHHLALATSLDPGQASMAMLLARLQLENGGNALETLERSLPYAESNAEYRAVMAGVLQRANRHKEAIEHYQAAVQLQPANAVWWMGLGISLQADKRNADAKAAFRRAAESGRLTPDLQSFVERRLQQLD